MFDFAKKIFRSFRSHPRNPDYWLRRLFGGIESEAGIQVSEETAMSYSAVYACVRIIAETIASLPLNVYKRLPSGGKQKDTNHYLYWLLHNQPNEDMTSFIWREVAMAHILLWGNHYSLLERDGMGKIYSIYPLLPYNMHVEMVVNPETGKKTKVYDYYSDNGIVRLQPHDVLHIAGLSFDGLVGKTPLGWYREQIGLGLAMQTYSSKFFRNGMHAGGIFTTPQSLKEETYQRLKNELKDKYAGLGKAHGIMLLEQDLKFNQISINPDDAQLLESKKFQVEEIARVFRVPLHLLQSLDRATNNNIEHQGIDFVTHTIRPWLVRNEQAYNMQLLTEGEKRTYFIEHIVDGLLRGDTESRYRSYNIARMGGWMNADEIRELENMNPMEDGQGKIYLAPLNMIPLNQLVGSSVREIGTENIEKTSKIAIENRDLITERLEKAYKPLFFNALIRILKREKTDVLKIIGKKYNEQDEKDEKILENYYKKHSEFVNLQIKQAIYAFAEALGADKAKTEDISIFSEYYGENFTKLYVESHLNELKGTKTDDFEVKFDNWLENEPEEISNREVRLISKAFSRYMEKIEEENKNN